MNANLTILVHLVVNGSMCLSDQAKIKFLEELVKDAKKEIKNGHILGIVALLFAFLGFFSLAASLVRLQHGVVGIGKAGATVVTGDFYIMIRAEPQESKRKRQLRNGET